MFDKTQKVNKEYADFLSEKNAQMINRLDNKSRDVGRDTLVWLCRAFAVMALIVGIVYITLAIIKITG